MKPIVLKMSAFGPYKKTETVDFRELNEHQLFVVSGSTGAGKTTIFDAICFALYGSSSGTDRDQTKMLRSDFADDDTHTGVELLFEIHGKRYRVLRQLSHIKEGRKTATGEKYEFYEVLSDGTEIAVVERQRVSDINPKLEEIIGLTYDQFSQIVMLPQGEFRKLLTSASENKEAILRKIFKTDRYGKMVKLLEERKVKAEVEARAVRAMRDSYVEQIAGALPPRESTLFTFLQQQANVYQIQEALLEEKQFYEVLTDENARKYEQSKIEFAKVNEQYLSAKSLNERIESFERLKIQLEELVKKKPIYEQKRMQAEAAQRATMLHYLDEQCKSMAAQLKEKKVQVEQFEQEHKLAQHAFEQATIVFQEEKERESIRQQANEHVSKLQTLVPVYTQIEQFKLEMEQATKQHALSKVHVEQLGHQLHIQKDLVSSKSKEMEANEQQLSELPSTIQAIHELEQVVKTLQQHQQVTKNHASLVQMYEQAHQHYLQAKEAYETEEQKWLSNQAQILASTLTPGCACPVCGSIEHQAVHFDETSKVNEATMEQLKAAMLNVEKQQNNVQIQMSVEAAKLKELSEGIQVANVSIEDVSTYEGKLLNLQQKQMDLQQLATVQQRLKQEQIAGLQLVNELEGQYNQAQIQLNEAAQKYFEKTSKYEQQQQLLEPTIADQQALNEAILQAKQVAMQLTNKWENVQKAFYDGQIAVQQKEQACQFTQVQINELTLKLDDSREQFKQKMQEAAFESYAAYSEAKLPETDIKQLQEDYMNFVNGLHALEMKVQEESAIVADKEIQNLEMLHANVLVLKQQEEQSFEQYKLAEKHELLCLQFHEKLELVAEQIYTLEQTTNELIDLHNLLKGQNSKKVSFERYVQIGYLEQITEAANVRLRNLSNGQYSLICSDRQESHGRQSGLSLDVYDSYTGQTRDVKTLSGGEKFNASLSLALGMAEVIQNFQGNVRIDTMFIDEGFGSLDEESLMRAIDTLFDLQHTGRMIGVISHVSELKDAFPAILHVEKQKEGYSKTHFVLK